MEDTANPMPAPATDPVESLEPEKDYYDSLANPPVYRHHRRRRCRSLSRYIRSEKLSGMVVNGAIAYGIVKLINWVTRD